MSSAPVLRRSPVRMGIAVAIALVVDVLHVVPVRAWLSPALQVLHRSYFSDVALPFLFYFLLCLVDDRAAWLRPAIRKGMVVFLASTGAELLQGLGCYALGRTFDPRDILMYGLGVGLATLLDVGILSRWVRAWPLQTPDAAS